MKKILSITLLMSLSICIYAGDVANFLNLGFSPNGKYFLFGEHGVENGFQRAYANMWLVNVERNEFVKGGKYSGEYDTVIEPGESSIGGLLKLLDKAKTKVTNSRIDYLDQGRPLYVRINESGDVNSLNFRDFTTGFTYKLDLKKSVRVTNETSYSSFSIILETIDNNGVSRVFNIGNPNYERKGVNDYKIDRILHSSRGSNLVIVISKFVENGKDVNVRYMVETISLN